MFFKRQASPKPPLFVPLLNLPPRWWQIKDRESWLVRQVCAERYRQQNRQGNGEPDEYTGRFGRHGQFSPPWMERSGLPWSEAVACVRQTVNDQSPVLIFGDYDCDGICSVTLMADALESAGLHADRIHPFIPNRMTDRYGLTMPALSRALEACPKPPALLIAVDCGSPIPASPAPLDFLRQRGIRTIVIDHHHTPVLGGDHPADFHLNPKGWPATVKRADLCDLSAAGLTYLFGDSLVADDEYGWDKSRAIILAGLATYADVVPILRLNRDLVREAIDLCNCPFTADAPLRKIPGLAALHERLNRGYVKKFGRLPKTGENTFGFDWGPCINASGRMADPDLSLRLLREKSVPAAEKLAAECVAMNDRRKYRQRKILEEARQQAQAQVQNDPPARVILVAARHWHKGVSGIVAARLRDEFHRPAMVCAWEKLEGDGQFMWTASGRSQDGFDLGEWLSKAKAEGRIFEGGGHKMAGGLRFSERQRPDLHRWLNQECPIENAIPKVELAVKFEDLTLPQWWEVMRQLRPFGQAHPYTPICLENAWLENVRFARFRKVNPAAAPGREPLEPGLNQPDEPPPDIYEFEEREPEDDGVPDSDCFAIGSFQSKHRQAGRTGNQPISNYIVMWKDVSRVRREWRKRRRYTLELDVIRQGSGYRLIVLDCWPEGDGQEFPPYQPAHPPEGLHRQLLQQMEMLQQRSALGSGKSGVLDQFLKQRGISP